MDSKPPRNASENLSTRLPMLRGTRNSSIKSILQEKGSRCQIRLQKDDMMIKENTSAEDAKSEMLPAVHLEMKGKYLIFRPIYVAERPPPPPNMGYNFKFLGNEVKIIRWICEDNGMRESKKEWILGWSNGSLRSNIYQNLNRWQKVNHFPRTIEITKKDCLFKNISRMQSIHGKKAYSFVPNTYVLPQDSQELLNEMDKDRSRVWIVKPAGSSQGRGIFLTNKISDIPPATPMVASEYISNPLLINGLKFDLRIYIAVSSIDPLRLYIYKEGLVRFATEPYNLDDPTNRFGHLTNYSLNKYAPNFQDLDQDGKGYKWTLSALKEFFAGKDINFNVIWEGIKDIAAKTLISIETTMNAGMNMFVPYSTNCFELLGFDILIDDQLRPWLLEVNLSPSMNTDTSIDLKVKSKLITDLFNLVGIPSRRMQEKRASSGSTLRPAWNSFTSNSNSDLSSQELRVIQETERELSRMGNFECIFPSENMHNYKQFFDIERPFNSLLMAHFANGSKKEIYKNQLYAYEVKIEKKRKEASLSRRERVVNNDIPAHPDLISLLLKRHSNGNY